MPSRASRSASTVLATGLAFLAALAVSTIARADEPAPPGAAPSPGPAPSGPALAAPAAAASVDPAEGKPPRPPPLPEAEEKTLPWDRLLDAGGDFTLVARPATHDAKGRPSRIRYQAATGFGLHIRWPLLKYLQIEGYYVDCHMPVGIPNGALGLADTVTSPSAETFVFGARISPRLAWGRLVGWLSAGAGWGRFEFPRMTATTSSGATYTLRERGASFVEVPLGLGVSWEVLPRWISIDVQATAAFVFGQRGDAFDDAQTVDDAGHVRNVGPMPIMDASLVQTIGLSLLL
jgi:hypothetical protein